MTGQRAATIDVNLLWCIPGKVGGSEEYLVRQLIGVAEHGRQAGVRVFAPRGFSVAHPEIVEAFEVIEAEFDSSSRARRVLGESRWLRSKTESARLVHHGGGTAPVGARQPYVLTIHDLQYRTFPHYFSAARRSYLKGMVPRSVEGAAAVTVPSEYVKATVIDAFGVDPARVHVVPHGVQPDLADAVTDEATLRRRYYLGRGPVLVYPAVTHPHKNHRFLLELMATRWRDPALRLVLCGGEGAAEAEVVSADLRVHRLGRVPDADRNGLLRLAAALVFPSEYEGFGAPVLEAMALGCPVVSSDRTCLPDVVGPGGLVLPLDLDQWADVPSIVTERRDTLIAAGAQQAARFTTAVSGGALADVYDLVGGAR